MEIFVLKISDKNLPMLKIIYNHQWIKENRVINNKVLLTLGKWLREILGIEACLSLALPLKVTRKDLNNQNKLAHSSQNNSWQRLGNSCNQRDQLERIVWLLRVIKITCHQIKLKRCRKWKRLDNKVWYLIKSWRNNRKQNIKELTQFWLRWMPQEVNILLALKNKMVILMIM